MWHPQDRQCVKKKIGFSAFEKKLFVGCVYHINTLCYMLLLQIISEFFQAGKYRHSSNYVYSNKISFPQIDWYDHCPESMICFNFYVAIFSIGFNVKLPYSITHTFGRSNMLQYWQWLLFFFAFFF